jgi:cytochrome c biogenesis protein CcmG, thiol:disulfide interchange protein DsbE
MPVGRSRARTAVVSVVALMLATVALAACGSSTGPSASGSSGAAPPLKGSTLDGGTFDLAAVTGKPTVVNFFASWCGPCNQEAPEVVAFARAHPDVRVVGVDTNDKSLDGRSFAEKYGITYPVVQDSNGAMAGDWGVTGIPTTFFIDRSGKVQTSIVGASTQAQFEENLSSIQ